MRQFTFSSLRQIYVKQSRRDAHDTTLMLILTISLFLATEVPLLIITALHTFSNSVQNIMDYNIGKNVILFINLLICFLDPVKLGIYCSMSRLGNS